VTYLWYENYYTIESNSGSFAANGLEVTGLADNLIKAKQKLDFKLKRMCSKKHQLRKTGIQSVLKTSYQSGMIDSIEKEFKCVVKLPQDLQVPVTGLLDGCDTEFGDSKGNVVGLYTSSTRLPL